MGRVKVQLKKIENKTYRQITFAKRKGGLVKKAYELSTLCDIDVGLIIFSPAGKLIIFDGKRRVEETLKRYIDLSYHQRGRVANQELVYRLLTQISTEAALWHQSNGDTNTRELNIQLEQIQNEINSRHAELEDVEKQLVPYLKSSSSIKSIREAKHHEKVLEAAKKRVSLHKRALEEEISRQIASQTPQPQTASASNFMMSPNYGLRWPQQHDRTQFLATSFANIPIGFKPFRNESDPFAEMLPSSMAFHNTGYPTRNAVSADPCQIQSSMACQHAGYPTGNAVNDGSAQIAPSTAFHAPRYLAGNAVNSGSGQFDSSEYDINFNADPNVGRHNIQQGRVSTATAGPSRVVNDGAGCSHSKSSWFHDFSNSAFPF